MKPKPKKSLGQHWLHDLESLHDIADAADVVGQDTILEVGPGLGTLTNVLAARAGSVVAIEFDHDLAANLPRRVQHDNVKVIEADILDFDFSTAPDVFKVVANIPYYLTSHLIRKLLELERPPKIIVLLIQKEVAMRIVAKPGGMSILSIASQYYAEVSLGVEVPRELFTPPPQVDSQVVILHPRDSPLFPDVDTDQFFRYVKAGFGEKRKKLLNSMSGGLHIEKPRMADILSRASIGDTARAQELTLDQWYEIYKSINGTLDL